MFTGIIEDVGKIEDIQTRYNNKTFWIASKIAKELKEGDSVSHNGVCLTIEEVDSNKSFYRVTAIQETLTKTNLGNLEIDSLINLERSLKAGSRIDGHFVMGHVDCTGTITRKKDRNGSYEFAISFPKKFAPYVILHGSIAIDGISLTVSNLDIVKNKRYFLFVNIIPFTWEHTNIRRWEIDTKVNIEFDLLGKYILNKEQFFS